MEQEPAPFDRRQRQLAILAAIAHRLQPWFRGGKESFHSLWQWLPNPGRRNVRGRGERAAYRLRERYGRAQSLPALSPGRHGECRQRYKRGLLAQLRGRRREFLRGLHYRAGHHPARRGHFEPSSKLDRKSVV